MKSYLDHFHQVTRRHFLSRTTMGVGSIALSSLFGNSVSAAAKALIAEPPLYDPRNPFAPRPSHFAPRAKRVIYLHMAGSPPQQDLLDYKPKLNELNGQLCPESFLENERFAFIKGHPKILGSDKLIVYRLKPLGLGLSTGPGTPNLLDQSSVNLPG